MSAAIVEIGTEGAEAIGSEAGEIEKVGSKIIPKLKNVTFKVKQLIKDKENVKAPGPSNNTHQDSHAINHLMDIGTGVMIGQSLSPSAAPPPAQPPSAAPVTGGKPKTHASILDMMISNKSTPSTKKQHPSYYGGNNYIGRLWQPCQTACIIILCILIICVINTNIKCDSTTMIFGLIIGPIIYWSYKYYTCL